LTLYILHIGRKKASFVIEKKQQASTEREGATTSQKPTGNKVESSEKMSLECLPISASVSGAVFLFFLAKPRKTKKWLIHCKYFHKPAGRALFFCERSEQKPGDFLFFLSLRLKNKKSPGVKQGCEIFAMNQPSPLSEHLRKSEGIPDSFSPSFPLYFQSVFGLWLRISRGLI
jgi:hypothetical protein